MHCACSLNVFTSGRNRLYLLLERKTNAKCLIVRRIGKIDKLEKIEELNSHYIWKAFEIQLFFYVN